MPTSLNELLAAIDPRRTLDELDRRADDAIWTFPFESPLITDWTDFRTTMASLLSHVETRLLRLTSTVPMDPDLAWGRCVRVLTQEYGPEGDKAAFEIARTGNEGGFYDLAKRFTRQIAWQCAENEIKARVNSFWHGLSVTEQLEVSSEYLAKYGHLLPSELTEGSAARVRAGFHKVLAEHPHMLQRLRQSTSHSRPSPYET